MRIIVIFSCMLGVKTGYIGKVGRDETGEFFRRDMEKTGITPILLEGKAPSGVAIGLISYDSERTFATYLGAAIELIPEDLTASMELVFQSLRKLSYSSF